MIDLKNIRKTYASGGRAVDALAGVDLHVGRGQVFGIIGRSGAGKSTLIRMINLLERPSSGEVWVDGTEVTSLSKAALREFRHSVGMIFQHFNLLRSRTVLDNVCFPLRLAGLPRKQQIKRAHELLELVDLSDHVRKYPRQLSGGQQQRVGIARALAAHPKLLLCDEATSALDPQTTQSILELLGNINRRLQLTIVLITHSMDVIRDVCDQVAVIEAGRIVEQGPVLDVFLQPENPATQALLSESGISGAQGWHDLAARTPGRLLRLSYRGEAIARPILSQLSRQLQLDLSILQGTVGHIKNTPYGQLIVAASGSTENLQAMGSLLSEAGVHCEVLRA